ncbi:hypothetical protein JJB98_28110 [Bradyrhizobium diazoefficiens]|nr:hypothetical protein [Bradyrhizobium diazoefficiens]QQO23522.1 hypothetical protein JJB98_28110 [Bradyrhizobium diazoefficiens]
MFRVYNCCLRLLTAPFSDEHFERGRPSSIIIVGWPFNEKQMLVGVPYLVIGVCVTVAAEFVTNWFI